MTRNGKILAQITQSMKVLEVGPSFSPVITRNDGWNVYSLDHNTADELRRKYAGHQNVDISRIQDVDFVWQNGPIETAFPEQELGTFDACIGSHMIEHVPDLVAFFKSMERILSSSGIISLVVPDKRFCFDFFQPISMSGDVLEAHRVKRTRHTRTAEFNAAAYMVFANSIVSWGQQPTGLLRFADGNLRSANDAFFRDDIDEAYRDFHGWYFTYSSFRLLMLELAWMGHLNFRECASFRTEGCEFFITLERGRPKYTEEEFGKLRMELLVNILLEVRDQTDYLIEGSNYVGHPLV